MSPVHALGRESKTEFELQRFVIPYSSYESLQCAGSGGHGINPECRFLAEDCLPSQFFEGLLWRKLPLKIQ
jgi:hypothetical protein